MKNKNRSKRNRPFIRISDHAYKRYFERVCKVDLSVIAKTIVTPQLIELVKICGDGAYKQNGHTIIVIENTIVTII